MVTLIRSAHAQDLDEIEHLLQRAGLTIAGVRDHLDGFEVAEEEGRIVASAGLEIYGAAALLRSVAVDPAHRNRGVARELVQRLLNRAAGNGAGAVYLLTTTAADYFRRFGFEAIARDDVALVVQASEEFGDAYCETAQAMRLRVVAPPAMRSVG